MNLKKYIKWSIGILIPVLFYSCSNKQESTVKKKEFVPSQITYNGTVLYSKNGFQALKLASGVMENYVIDTNIVKVRDGVRAWFYDDKGIQSSYLEGDSANYFDIKGKLDTYGDVMLGNKDGDTLHTKHLIWYRDSQLVVAPGKVIIETPDGIIYGRGLKAQEDFSSYSLKEVSGEFELKDSIQ